MKSSMSISALGHGGTKGNNANHGNRKKYCCFGRKLSMYGMIFLIKSSLC